MKQKEVRIRWFAALLSAVAGACAIAQEPVPVLAAPAAEAEPAEYAGMLEAHNFWRRQVGSRDLVWSSDAARQAQSWADELADNECQARHSKDEARRQKFGENIYFYWSSRPYEGYRREPPTVVESWGKEIDYYDEQLNECRAPAGKSCRHYTQVVWSRSQAVGCGRSRCESAEIWVCEYTPRGNLYPVRPYEPADKPRASAAESGSPALR